MGKFRLIYVKDCLKYCINSYCTKSYRVLTFMLVIIFLLWGRGEVCTGFWWGNLRERNHCGDPDVDGRIILRRIFRKWEGVVGTGWSWLRIGTGGGYL